MLNGFYLRRALLLGWAFAALQISRRRRSLILQFAIHMASLALLFLLFGTILKQNLPGYGPYFGHLGIGFVIWLSLALSVGDSAQAGSRWLSTLRYASLPLLAQPLEAFRELGDVEGAQPSLHIHGANLQSQPAEFQQAFEELVAAQRERVHFHGPYRNGDVYDLMEAVDWVVVPSRWWENSPLVISEAYNVGRPVICADIGGMAEKVADGGTGFHYQARSVMSLRETLERAQRSPDLWDKLYGQIKGGRWVGDVADELLELYRGILGGERAAAAQ